VHQAELKQHHAEIHECVPAWRFTRKAKWIGDYGSGTLWFRALEASDGGS